MEGQQAKEKTEQPVVTSASESVSSDNNSREKAADKPESNEDGKVTKI
ncbi:hypothetical protein ABE208_04695 [Bacillus inaquosorum]|nr:hypothetical protein [Bacillus inaquosorum]MEC0958991.1 hypothetical protein [Bacillus inaquosorum]UTX03875.1 hypothetical protein NM058_11510 [Bacillus inaquosorum]